MGRTRPASGSVLLRPGARELDDFGPLLGFVDHKRPELGGRHRHRIGAQIFDPSLELRTVRAHSDESHFDARPSLSGHWLAPKPATEDDCCEHSHELRYDERRDAGRRDPRKRIGQRADIVSCPLGPNNGHWPVIRSPRRRGRARSAEFRRRASSRSSALGHKQISRRAEAMSAVPPKADIARRDRHIR
jgi:hypothetical protein